jgi:hypothetical protein
MLRRSPIFFLLNHLENIFFGNPSPGSAAGLNYRQINTFFSCDRFCKS